jgi:outer membrane protein TolC
MIGRAFWGGWFAVSLLLCTPLHAQEISDNPAAVTEDEYVLEPGEIPDYDVLRFQGGEQTSLENSFLTSLPTAPEDVLTSGVVFPEVPPTAPYALLALPELIDISLQGNFALQNSARGVLIARSSVRSAESTFIPYVDLVADSRYISDRNENASRFDPSTGRTVDTTRESGTWTNSAGVESGVGLPTGGNVILNGGQRRTDTRVSDGTGTLEDRLFDSNGEVRYVQPLLRGGGFDVGTAELRRSRINEMSTIISHRLEERDVVLSVIQTYFQILQSARQLQVSSEAIRKRYDVLEETRIRFMKGREDESKILTAEIQYLSQLETAIGQRRTLDELRENMLLLLGLPMDTPISFIDITEQLAVRGRVDIPPVEDSVEEAMDSRLELMRSDLNVALSRIDYSLARNQTLPDLDFSSGYGRSDSSSDYSNSTGFENSGWDVGMGLRVPLINIRRKEAFKRAGFSLETAETNRIQLQRVLTQEVLRSHRNVLATEAQLTVVSKNVEQARRALDLITGRFEVGFATNTEVRLTQDDLFAAATRYNNALLNYQIALARLYVALGRPLY